MGLCKSNNINTQFIFNQEVIHEKFWNKKTKIYEIIQDFKVDYDKGDLFYFEINNEEIDLKKNNRLSIKLEQINHIYQKYIQIP